MKLPPRTGKPRGLKYKHGRESLDTATSKLILEHYRKIGIAAGWTPVRFKRLAGMLNLTVWELGRLVGCWRPASWSRKNKYPDHSLCGWFMATNFPPYIALHCAYLESWALRVIAASKGIRVPEPVPIMPLDILPLHD